MKHISHIELGATLFVPANHKNLKDIALGIKYPTLKSLVIDFEDSILSSDIKDAKRNLKKVLKALKKYRTKVLVFLRPRDVRSLKNLLMLKNINYLIGFVLPKFSLDNSMQYLKLLKGKDFLFMPSIEGKELFSTKELIKLKNLLLPFKDKILTIRFGLEDMLKQLSMKRKRDFSVFDISVTSTILGQFLAVFKGADFNVSGGVYPYFNDKKGFLKDVKRDIQEGLFSKTIIHPNQIEPVNKLYRVSTAELNDALEIIFSDKVIFNQNGVMAETLTMSNYSKHIIKRALVYGTN